LAILQALKMQGTSLPFPLFVASIGQDQGAANATRQRQDQNSLLRRRFVKRTAKLEASEFAKAEQRMARHNEQISKRGKKQ
jgi:hypothetical protein